MNKNVPLVVIWCTTYNHEPYIKDALNGFIMQQTNFPFIAIIHDDCSTDNTTTILREYAEKYPDIIKPIFETENQYSKKDGTIDRIMEKSIKESGAKYTALCEGDDYWIDPLKLQKQVNFLESHPDYGMVYSDFDKLYQSSGKIVKSVFSKLKNRIKRKYNSVEDFILEKGYVAPPSWLFKTELYEPDPFKSCDGTYVLFTHFLAKTNVHVFKESMVVYRILKESASHSSDLRVIDHRIKNLLNTQLKLCDLYGCSEQFRLKCIQQHYRDFLSYFIFNKRESEIIEAKKRILKKNFKERLLFITYTHFRPILPILNSLIITLKNLAIRCE